MGSVSSNTYYFNSPAFTGTLFQVGGRNAGFLEALGGLNGGRFKLIGDLQFNLGTTWAPNAGAQPAITEVQSMTGATVTTYARTADRQTAQIFQEAIKVSFLKMSTPRVVFEAETGTSGYAQVDLGAQREYQDELDLQIATHMTQIGENYAASILVGSYQQATASNVAPKMRGVVTGTSTNAVAAGTTDLSKAHIDTLCRTMAGNGAVFRDMAFVVNAFNMQRISTIYGYAPMDRMVGGVQIRQVYTDFGLFAVLYDRNITATVVALIDMSVCSPIGVPKPAGPNTPGGYLFYHDTAQTAASEGGEIYAQLSIDYGPEEYHGKITGTTSS